MSLFLEKRSITLVLHRAKSVRDPLNEIAGCHSPCIFYTKTQSEPPQDPRCKIVQKSLSPVEYRHFLRSKKGVLCRFLERNAPFWHYRRIVFEQIETHPNRRLVVDSTICPDLPACNLSVINSQVLKLKIVLSLQPSAFSLRNNIFFSLSLKADR